MHDVLLIFYFILHEILCLTVPLNIVTLTLLVRSDFPDPVLFDQ